MQMLKAQNMNRFMGLDASTQSLTAVIIDTEQGRVIGKDSVDFDSLPEFGCVQGVLPNEDPLVKHSDPRLWAAALEKLLGRLRDEGLDLSRVKAVSGSGQQHGTVYLNKLFPSDGNWRQDRPLKEQLEPMLSRATAPVWMDGSTTEECREIAESAGGIEYIQRSTGSPPIERFAGPQIRKFHKNAPELYEKTEIIHLISSFMGSILAGKNIPIDFADGGGMNFMNLAAGEWDERILKATAPGLREKLPALAPSWSKVGRIAPYFVSKYGFSPETELIAWSGDNPNSLIGVGAYAPGAAVISLGTSHTFFAPMNEPKVDPRGYGHVFGSPSGGFMSLICFKNGALAQEEIRKQAGINWNQFDQYLDNTPPGNNGNMMLPYFIPEITPLVSRNEPVYRGSEDFREGRDMPARVRAVVEAQALRLRLYSDWIEERSQLLRVTGGAAKSTPVCQILADVFNAPIERLEISDSAALGAALRAAHGAGQADWPELIETFCRPVPESRVEPVPENVRVYDQMLPIYAELAAEA